MSIASKVLISTIFFNRKFLCFIHIQRRIGSTGAAERRATGFKGREGGTKMIEISDAPSMKKEKKRKSKKDKDAENADSDDGKKRRESQSSQGSISPKPGARRRNSSVSSGPFDEVC